MSATSTFDWPQTADDLRQNYAALSIQTRPKEAQDVINYIKNFSPSSNDYKLLSKKLCHGLSRYTEGYRLDPKGQPANHSV
jgi:hypothetical protein